MPALLPRIRVHRPGWDVLTLTCLALLVVQVVLSLMGGYPVARPVYEQFGLSRDGLFDGKVWQLGTHALIHGNWFHFAMNTALIYLVGGRVFHILGGRRFALIFWGGVLLGSVLHLGLHPAQPLGIGEAAYVPLVGASAGAMALLLALTTLSPDSRMWPVPVSGKNLGRGLLLGSLVLFLITPGLKVPGLSEVGTWLVDAGQGALFQFGHAYHLGGGLMGWFLARRLLGRPVSLEQLRAERARREGVAA